MAPLTLQKSIDQGLNLLLWAGLAHTSTTDIFFYSHTKYYLLDGVLGFWGFGVIGVHF